jgi:hypothetical protein
MIRNRKKIDKFDKEDTNIASFLLLPLCGVNALSFNGFSNFHQSYLACKKEAFSQPVEERLYYMVIDIYDKGLRAYSRYDNFILDYEVFSDTNVHLFTRLLFNIPAIYNPDCEAFRKGKYRQMAETTKSIIYEDSGLYYKNLSVDKDGNKTYLTHQLLMAIAGDKQMKERLEANLLLHEKWQKLAPDAELWDLPKVSEFYVLHENNVNL